MKITGIFLLIVSTGYGVVLYTRQMKQTLSELNEWCLVLAAWQEEIAAFGFAVDELGKRLADHPVCRSLALTEKISDRPMTEIAEYVAGEECPLRAEDKEYLTCVLSSLGSYLTETQDKQLGESVQTMKNRAREYEETVRRKCGLLYKIAPLVCGALIVICW